MQRDPALRKAAALATKSLQQTTVVDIDSCSEFPSLSGAPRPQHQNSGQDVWAQRANQQNQTQRSLPQQQPTTQGQSQTQQQAPSSQDDPFPTASQFSSGLDEFRHGGPGISGQLQGSAQPRTTSIDEFPPLGREISMTVGDREGAPGSERRNSLMQHTGFGAYTNGAMAFAGMNQTLQRNPLSNPLNASQDYNRLTSPSAPGLIPSSTSRPSLAQGQNGGNGQDNLGAIGSGTDNNIAASAVESQRIARQAEYQSQSQQSRQQASVEGIFGNDDMADSPAGSMSQQPPQGHPQNASQMSELDRFGLNGLLASIRNPSAAIASMAHGHDLTTLGLNLNQTSPLYPHFSTPFGPTAPTRPLEIDFNVPGCYTVANVPPLHERIPGFSEETLFYIFYSKPRDIMQELVAQELKTRKWRYHKREKMWVTRDESFASPVEVEHEVSESGTYLWWDWQNWKRVRRQYVLRYEDLDDRGQATVGGMAQPGNGGGPSGGFNPAPGLSSLAGGAAAGPMGFRRGL